MEVFVVTLEERPVGVYSSYQLAKKAMVAYCVRSADACGLADRSFEHMQHFIAIANLSKVTKLTMDTAIFP